MRILILSNLYPPNVVGGYERLCFDVTAGLAALGHEMVVLTTRYGGQVADYPGQRILREWDLLTGPDIYTPYAGTAEEREAVNQTNLATLHRVLADVQPDVVFAWNLFFLDSGLLASLEKGTHRTVVMLTDNWLLVMRNPIFVRDFFAGTVHGAVPFAPPPPPSLWQRVRRKLSNRPPRGLEAVFGSTFMRDFYAAGGSSFDRSVVIHNGVRQAGYDRALIDRTRLVQPGTLHLLFAGRLVDLKGAHTAVAAMPLLDPMALGVERIQLTLLGDTQDAAYTAQLEAAITQSGQGTNIVMRPVVPEGELPALFDSHDIYLFPSLYEPFSLTLIHALALGIPTVASRVGGNPEIVTDGESGLLFAKGDAADLASAISRLARDGSLRSRLAAAGRNAARQFTFDRMIGEMAKFLAEPP